MLKNYVTFRMKRPLDWITVILSIVLMGDNHKILLESLITNQGPLNGSYETHWPFNGEDAPINAGRLTSSSANFLVNHSPSPLRHFPTRKLKIIITNPETAF